MVNTVAGTGAAGYLDGPVGEAQFNAPYGICVDNAGNGYIGDKLNIPVAELNKQNIEAHLLNKQVNTETVKKLLDTLNDCEVARYAPSAVSAEINTVYNNTVQLIETIENEAKS